MESIFLILGTLCLLVLYKLLTAAYQAYVFNRTINKIPGPSDPLRLAIGYKLIKMPKEDRLKWFEDLSFQYNEGIFRLWVASECAVHIRSPKHLEAILPSTVNIQKSMVYDFISDWLGQGLITSTGPKWFHDRKLLTPAFHFNILEQYQVVMIEKAEILVRRIDEALKEDPKKPIDVFDYVIRCVLDALCETAMGVDVHAQDKEQSEYAKALYRFSELIFERVFQPWLRSDWIFSRTAIGKEYHSVVKTMHDFARQVIKQKMEARKLQNGVSTTQKASTEDADENIYKRKRKVFLDLLLDANEKDANPLSDEEVREQVDTFMFAGHDTTGAAICWALFCLGNNPEVQEKVHEELNDIFGDSDEPATSKELSELTYLDRVMKEALRLYPSVPGISRRCVEEFTMGGYVIPKGAIVSLSPYLTHRDPEYWPNPTVFDPDRFLPENIKDRHPYAYIPFSAGPRNCIGQKFAQMEEKIVLTAILRKWRVKSVESPETIKMFAGLILRPIDGIYLYLTRKK